jgi:hypothetical protein
VDENTHDACTSYIVCQFLHAKKSGADLCYGGRSPKGRGQWTIKKKTFLVNNKMEFVG